MKITLILSTFIYSSYVFSALGGVDVGNGKVIEVEVQVKRHFLSERELVDHVESKTTEIKIGEYLSIKDMIRKHDCYKEAAIDNLEVLTEYPFNNGVLGDKEYNGVLKIKLNDCKK